MIPKFRAWFDSEMYEKTIICDGDLYLDYSDLLNGDMCNGAIIMQSTGLLDKNGKEIFESDIVEWEHKDTGQLVRGIVKYDTELGFWGMTDVRFNDLTAIGYLANKRITVLGNIYQNSEEI